MSKPPLLSQDEIALALTALNAGTDNVWTIDEGKLRRRYDFKTFNDAFGFMSQTALICEKLNHHPRWMNVYNRVDISLFTFGVGGLTHLDFELATNMEKLAKRFLV